MTGRRGNRSLEGLGDWSGDFHLLIRKDPGRGPGSPPLTLCPACFASLLMVGAGWEDKQLLGQTSFLLGPCWWGDLEGLRWGKRAALPCAEKA